MSNSNGSNGNGKIGHNSGQLRPGYDPRRGVGKKGRSGRKPAKWHEACAQALKDAKAIPVLQEMISGDIKEQVGVDRKGKPIYGETRNSDRLGAVKFLAGYAHGEPVQPIEATVTQYVIEVPPKAQTAEEWRRQFSKRADPQ